jgi:hypothetical protein
MFKTKHSIIKSKYLLVKNYLDMNPPKKSTEPDGNHSKKILHSHFIRAPYTLLTII